MPRTTRYRPFRYGLLVALAVLGGCSSTVTGVPAADPAPAPTEGPGSDPVAWDNRVCGSVLAFATPLAAPPDFRTSADLPGLKKSFSTYLGTVVAGAQKSSTQLDGVGRSPAAGGDEVVGQTRTAVAKLQKDFAGAKATIDAADPNNPQAFVAALGKAQTTLNGVTAPDVLGGIAKLPRLGPAAEKSDQCRKLSAMAAAAPR